MKLVAITRGEPKRRFIQTTIIGFVGVYLALLLLASSCPLASAPPDQHQHHETHHGMAAHSLLCAWACQASCSAALPPLREISQPLLILIGLGVPLLFPSCLACFAGRRSRAPPTLLLSH